VLVELVVENYAVIERARVRFHPGLNLLTGETGSGKSLVVDALGLLFGGRASAEMVRAGSERARISGVFEIVRTPALARLLEEAGAEAPPANSIGWPIEDGELLVEREIQSNGKSRALVSNRPATVALLKALAPFLGDIHGQHDQQQLFSPCLQCEMLDAYAQSQSLLEETGLSYRAWREASRELEDLDRTAQEKLRQADLWNFQRQEIEAVAPSPGEDEELENERRILRNIVRLQENAAAAYAALYENPQSAASQLHVVEKRLEEIARIDPNVDEMAALLRPATIALDEASRALVHYLGRLEADPARLEEVESRLATLEKLKRKYGAKTEDILAFLENVKADLSAVENSSERREFLRGEIARISAAYENSSRQLTVQRKQAALQLAKRVQTELTALAMEKARLEIVVQPAAWSERGADSVQFLISPNPGEEPKPLERIASGGELSRVALALKTVGQSNGTSAQASTCPTLVFDEIDAGVGGSAAEAVGRRLKKLARDAQVICVTHLPQIAGFADHHYYVEKRSVRGRTLATVDELSPQSRTQEIGRMLSGEQVTPEALRHAEHLMKLGSEC
jgi:DNA repair protein RecN (Recombination protein N)